MKVMLYAIAASVGLLAIALVLALVLGSPRTPVPIKSINNPFKSVDYTGLPPVSRYPARDGSALAFRHYASGSAPGRGSVVLLHGSSASSRSMHSIASAFAAAGYAAYALDVRGHGDSGTKGDIGYVGQLENDLEDFVSAVRPVAPVTLVGFSSGGGFALRVAGSSHQRLFANYLLLSPFISQDAPTSRPASGGWVSVGIPRYIAIGILDRSGIRALNHLPVICYALDDDAKKFLTPCYSFNLAQNYRPEPDYKETIRAAAQPMRIIVGSDDELFYADRFQALFRDAGKNVEMDMIPGVNHISMILDPDALRAAVAAVGRLHRL